MPRFERGVAGESPAARSIFLRVAEDTQLYQIVHVDGDQLRYEAHTATGRLYDAFTLDKKPGQPNQLTEQVPATPENIRPPVEKTP